MLLAENLSSGNYFITGTDTDSGKTYVSTLWLKTLSEKNKKTLGVKPLSCGNEWTEQGWRHADALRLMENSSVQLPYEQINPVCLPLPISPNIAAEKNNTKITVAQIVSACQPALSCKKDLLLVEGVGGWHCPLNDTETVADLAMAFNFPVVLVVGIRLGCLNHAMLTWQAVQRSQLPIAGWVANCLDSQMQMIAENIETLTVHLKQPPLSVVGYQC